MRKISWILLVVIFASFWLSGTVFAQGEQPGGPTDDEVNSVAKQLYCPVCENVPLDVCPTQACAEWRELIRLKLSEGWDTEQIKLYFAEQYGDRVLAAPPARGFNWLVYILPPLAILAGVYVLFRAVKAWRQPVAVDQSANDLAEVATLPDDEYVARIEDALKKSK